MSRPLFEEHPDSAGREYLEVNLSGIALLRLPLLNKGTGFTQEERVSLGLDGLLPPQVNSIEQQVERVYAGFCDQPSPIAKYQFLRALQDRSEVLFFALLERHLAEMLPIVYTPTVGLAVQRFSHLYQSPRGISLAPTNIGRAGACLTNYPMRDVRMIVATDSSAILGIGDQGYGGLAIPIGKLALYTVAGGVSPYRTMPVSLDVGTDRDDLITDPMYLGVRQRRLRGDEYLEFMDRFVSAVRERYPDAVIQWEDLAKEAAFSVLERYRREHPSFNDDIQGTGAVALAGVLGACALTGRSLMDQTVVVYGAGAGGVGVAWALREGLVREGLSPERAARRILVIDSKGLLVQSRKLEAYKQPFAQPDELVQGWSAGAYPDLVETIERSGATVLLGLSGQPGSFTERAVRAVHANTPRPIVFPLSNPTSACEAKPADVYAWTRGQAIVASGSPFDPVELDGETHVVGQGNNAFIFPGLGQGAITCQAREITDGMVLAAAYALADFTKERYVERGLVYPPVTDLREASVRVATAVMREAARAGVCRRTIAEADLEGTVRREFWLPRYVPFVRGRDAG